MSNLCGRCTFRSKEIWLDAANNFVIYPNRYNSSDAAVAVIREEMEEGSDLVPGPSLMHSWINKAKQFSF